VPTHQVTDIELDRASELRVSFADGVTAMFPLLGLREQCPCATCRGRREQGATAFTGDSIDASDAHLHGNWGISITWSDGHSTGIYGWEYLRGLWDHRAPGGTTVRTEYPRSE
jgi:DUF971 family protein